MYDTIILGSGYFSFGYAIGHPGSIVVEKSQLCDINFYGAFSGFFQGNYKITNNECFKLKKCFSEFGILSDEKVNVNALESVFCLFLKDKPINLLLNTECISISGSDRLFRVEIYNSGGINVLYSRKLIDARQKNKNCINILVYLNDTGCADMKNRFTVSEAFYPEEYIVSYRSEKDINTSKLEFYNLWKEVITPNNGKIISYAYSMNGIYSEPYSDGNYMECNDLWFGNVFKAFESGISSDF